MVIADQAQLPQLTGYLCLFRYEQSPASRISTWDHMPRAKLFLYSRAPWPSTYIDIAFYRPFQYRQMGV